MALTAADINDYLREVTGGDYTTKDFRTWHTTVLAAVGLAVSEGADSDAVIERYQDGHTITSALGDLGQDCDFGDLATTGRGESAVVKLRDARPSPSASEPA